MSSRHDLAMGGLRDDVADSQDADKQKLEKRLKDIERRLDNQYAETEEILRRLAKLERSVSSRK